MAYSWLHPHGEVRETAGGERGVFAARPIARDELVALWGGVIYSDEQAERLSEQLKRYLLKVDSGFWIGPASVDALDAGEYVNHSCAPNCGLKGQIGLVAMRDIAAGEELTFDYAMAEDVDQSFECGCGAPVCRGKLSGADAFRPELVRRYRGYHSTWLARELGGTQGLRDFIRHHYRHFNAAALTDAAEGYTAHLERGGKMFVTLAGAMSTAELGLSLAEMIRRDKVHAICCTGANLEEDLFNLVAHEHYRRVPQWRNLTPADEKELERQGLNRVTDTCIPEDKAFRAIEQPMLDAWRKAEAAGERLLPHQFFYRVLREGELAGRYQIDPRDSWLVAAAERDLPLFVPGWEDSTLGNIFVSHVIAGDLASYQTVRGGLEYMAALAEWYLETTAETPAGFFQIGGGIAGDFPICVVPMIHQDLQRPCPYWGYFCQISDSTTSYGGYSGAIPSEKITWGKLDVDTPMHVIESDATIVAPLVFAYVLGW